MIPILILAFFLLALTGTVWYVVYRVRSGFKNLFGTDSLSELVKQRDQEMASTPKSVSGMTELYAGQICKDFPEANITELFKMAEDEMKKHAFSLGYQDLQIHRSAIFDYKKKAGTCVIVFQSSVQYQFKNKTVQSRFNTHLIYVQDQNKVGNGTGFAVNCPNCGGEIIDLGAKHCRYCGSAIIPINIHVWKLYKVEELKSTAI